MAERGNEFVTDEHSPGGRPGRPQRRREVPARRAARTPGPAARRLLQGRRRPDAAAHRPRRQRRARRLGPPRLLARGRTRWPRCASSARPGAARCRSTRSRRTVDAARGRRPRTAARASSPRASSLPTSWPRAATEGLLAAAYCITQHPLVTFWRRLTRDLREHRKPPAGARAPRLRPDPRPAARGRPRPPPGVPARDRRPGVRRAEQRGGRTGGEAPPARPPLLRRRRPGHGTQARAPPLRRARERPGDLRARGRTLHRRLTSLSDTAGGWQVPWPRALGTPPWAVARELGLLTGVPYAVRSVRLGRRAWPHLRRDAAAAGRGLRRRPVAAPPRRAGHRRRAGHHPRPTSPRPGSTPRCRGSAGSGRPRARRLGPAVAGVAA